MSSLNGMGSLTFDDLSFPEKRKILRQYFIQDNNNESSVK